MSTAAYAVLISALWCAAASPAPPDKAPAAADTVGFADEIRKLGDKEFRVREAAAERLWAAGAAAEAALREALKSEDAEVVGRARDILERFKWGLYPDTPAEIAELVREYRAGMPNNKAEVVRKLMDIGGKAYAVLLKIAAAEENADTRRQVFGPVVRRAGEAATGLMIQGDPVGAERVLQLGTAAGDSDAIHHYAAFLLANGRLDAKLAELRSAGAGDPPAEMLTVFCRAAGDSAGMRKALDSAPPHIRTAALAELRDYKALLPLTAGDGVEAVGFRLAYARLAGDSAAYDAALGELNKLGAAKDASDCWFVAEALLINDLPEQAIAALTAGGRHWAVLDLRLAQMRYADAFAAADRAEAGDKENRLGVRLSRAKTLHQLGDKVAAARIFTAMGAEIPQAKNAQPYGALVEAEVRLGLHDAARTHALAILARMTGDDHGWLLNRLFPKRGQAAGTLWQILKRKSPDAAPADLLHRLADLLEGRAGTEALAELRENIRSVPRSGPVATGTASPLELEWSALAEVAAAYGQADTARECLKEAAKLSTRWEPWAALGDHCADRRLWDAAADAYESAFESDKTRMANLYLHGWALVKLGKLAEGGKKMELAHAAAMANEDQRAAIAEAAAKRGLTAEVRRQHEWILKIGRFGSWHVGDSRRRCAEMAAEAGDWAKAADLWEMSNLDCLKTSTAYLETGAYLAVPQMIHQYRAMALLKAGKADEAMKEVRLCRAALPAEIEMVIRVVPELERLGRKADADALFGETFALRESICRDRPDSAPRHNEAAWLAARCGRELDKALTHARRAVELSPDSTACLDTLAEVLFRLGKSDDAVATMEKCVKLDPASDHYRTQLARFRGGK